MSPQPTAPGPGRRTRRTRNFGASLRAIAAITALVALASCGGGDEPADPLAPFLQQGLAWTTCPPTLVPGGYAGTTYAETLAALGSRVQCATFRAPLDYADPARGELTVALLRVSAEAVPPARRSLLFNPGGPGDDGLFLAPLFASLWTGANPQDATGRLFKSLSQTYDLIGFSPRGTGASTRLYCGLNEHAPFYRNPAADRSAGNVQAMLDTARLQAEACRRNPLTPYINTDATVRDMDLLRRLLGEDRLNYFGFSYGTWLGTWYASVFPERVGRMVLSGSVDVTTSLPGVFLLQGQGFQRVLDDVLAPYAARHPDRFKLGGDPEAVRRIPRELPIDLRDAVTQSLIGSMGNSSKADANVAGLRAAQLLRGWIAEPGATEETVAARIAAAAFVPDASLNATAQSLALEMSSGYFYLSSRATEPVVLEPQKATQWAVACNDSAVGWEAAAWVRDNDRVAALYPFFGGYWTALPCLYWGAPPVARPALEGAARAGGILILQPSLDPQTPVEGARRTFAALPNASMVEVDGESGHGVLPPYGKACVDQPFAEYLLSGSLPGRGPVHCAAKPLAADALAAAGGDKRLVADGYDAMFADPAAARRLREAIEAIVGRAARPGR